MMTWSIFPVLSWKVKVIKGVIEDFIALLSISGFFDDSRETYFRELETRCENGFSHAYIFITWIPQIISSISRILSSVS